MSAISGLTLGLLLLLGSLAAGTQETKSTREHLARNTLDDGNDMTSIQRLLLITDLLLFHQKKALALDLDIIVLLLRWSLAQTATATDAAIRCD